MDNVELVTVTPEIAREWLGYNTHNRKLRDRTVNAYAADMQASDWQWNGEAIKFGADGTLLDGQHRLAAVVESDTEVPMLVVRGLPQQVQDTVDGGVKRRFSDVLSLRGETSAPLLAAITRRVVIWEWGYRKSFSTVAPTNAQLIQSLDKYPELRDITNFAHKITAGCAIPGSVCGFGIWLFGQIDAEDSDFFFERLGDGQGLVKGDPIYELRRAADASRTARGKRSDIYLTAIMIKAWNAYRRGIKVGLLQFRPGGANPERFPEPQ